MEYEDFLDTWTLVHRVRLFDPSWMMSSLWINANLRGPASAWDYGDVSCMFQVLFLLVSTQLLTLISLKSYVQDARCIASNNRPRPARRSLLLRALRL